ncbi:MAG: metallopeptidase, partial [Planctomycetota bacterium]
SEGRNVIEFTGSGGAKIEFAINYQPQTNPNYVRVIWMTDRTENTDYAVPDESYEQDYVSRLQTAAELMQCFTAERMNDAGLGRRTFRLERDETGQVVVHTWSARFDAEQYYAMNDQEWYHHVNQWINSTYPDENAKNIVLAAFTRKDPESGRMKAHTALGGGNMGLFGSASVFSWPVSIEATTATFLDTSQFDTTKVHDDSVWRSNIWGLASTTIGATLHEMGHAFGLMHVEDERGIMRRGFDQFNRTFTFVDPPSGVNPRAVFFDSDREAHFAPISSSMLQWSRWFQLDSTPRQESDRVAIKFDLELDAYIFESESGIPWIGFLTGNFDVTAYLEFESSDIKTKVILTRDQINDLVGIDSAVAMIAIDRAGNIGRKDINN